MQFAAPGEPERRGKSRSMPTRRVAALASRKDRGRVTASLAAIFLFCQACGGCGPAPNSAWRMERQIGPFVISPSAAQPYVMREAFQVRNPSSEAMHLKLKRRSCNCTDYTIEPSDVPAGGESLITVRTTLPAMTDKHHFWLVFDTKLKERPLLQIDLDVKTIASLAIEPAEIPPMHIGLGESKDIDLLVTAARRLDDEARSLSLALREAGDVVTLLKVGGDVERAGPLEISKANYRARLRCPEDVSPGEREIRLHARGGGAALDIPLRWSPSFPVQVEPQQLFIQAVKGGAASKRVRARANAPFSVTRLATDSPHVRATAITSGRRAEHELEISVCAEAGAPRSFSSSVTIATDARVEGRQAPIEFACTVMILNFAGAND